MWQCLGKSVLGASHRRSEKPNQDAFAIKGSEEDFPAIAVVSDGHGGDKYIRSDKGAKIAVELATQHFIENSVQLNLSYPFSPQKLQETIEHLKANYIVNWRQRVKKDLEQNPFSQEEKTRLEEKLGEQVMQEVTTITGDNFLAYGCTLLVAAAYERVIVTWQLGDGDIVLLDEDNQPERLTVNDSRMMANETLSLCDISKLSDIKCQIILILPDENQRLAKDSDDINYQIILKNKFPRLIMLSSDGVSNSFGESSSFLKIAANMPALIKNKGIEQTAAELEDFLQMVTSKGSGDDVTLAVLYREDEETKDKGAS